MDGKIKSYQDLLASWNKLTGSAPRQTALDSEGLNYIGRPMDQLSEEQKEEMFAPQEDKLALEAIAAEQPQEVQEESVEKPLEEPTPLALNDIMNEPEQIALDKISTLPQEAPKKSREEELMDQYLKEKDLYAKQIEDAYAAERKSQMAQNVIEGLGKAFIYNKYARVAPPMPINIKPMDMKYVEEAKEKGKNKLDTYKELLAQVKKNSDNKLRTDIVDLGDRKEMWTYSNEGDVLKKQEIGKKAMTEAQKAANNLGIMREEGTQSRFEANLGFKKEGREREEVEKPLKAFNADKDVVKANSMMASAEIAEELLKGNNPIAQNAVPTFMARLSGEVGALSEADKAPFGGSQAIATRLQQYAKKMTDGTLTQENKKYIYDLVQKLKNTSIDIKNNKAEYISKQFSYTGRNPDEVKSYLLATPVSESYKSIYTPSQEKLIEKVIDKKGLDRDSAIQYLQQYHKDKGF